MKIYFTQLTVALGLSLLIGCSDGDSSTQTTTTKKDDTKTSAASGTIVNLDGQLFSIPSPIQTAMFIQKNGSGYNGALMAPVEKAKMMTTANSKAMAMGMYGADLGYLSIFGDQDKALPYMAAVRMLSDDMGLAGAFDESLVERFSDNVGKTDSMLVLISDLYESSDAYLKNNKRSDVAALVLLGGWIEGLHFSCNEAVGGSDAMKKRVAEQKTSLDRLIAMLGQYSSSTAMEGIVSDLTSLKSDFDNINSTYTYRKPETLAGDQTTVIKGKVIHQMTDETLKSIAAKVTEMRNALIG